MLFAFHPESALGEFFSDHYRACLILSSTVLLTAFLLLSSPLLFFFFIHCSLEQTRQFPFVPIEGTLMLMTNYGCTLAQTQLPVIWVVVVLTTTTTFATYTTAAFPACWSHSSTRPFATSSGDVFTFATLALCAVVN